jgi:hypothetical protein
MAKRTWVGLAVLGCGALVGILSGGTFGLALAAVCLVIGLVLFVASETRGLRPAPTTTSEADLSSHKTNLLVLVKEVHVRPQRSGKFQEITDPNQPDLEFEIFAHCWLVNVTEDRLGIPLIQMSLTKPDGTHLVLQRVPGDLDKWRLGRLRDELDSWGIRYLQAAQEEMPELDITEPIEGGATRQGWLHLRVEHLTPAELRTSPITLSIIDSHCKSHLGVAKGPHQVPGRVWPFLGKRDGVPASSEAPSPQGGGRAMTGT